MLTAQNKTNIAPHAKPTLRGHATKKTPPQRKIDGEHNRVWRSLATGPNAIQPKLIVSQHDDPDEQEADRVAERVMRMPASPSGASESIHARKVQDKLHRKEEASNAASSTNAPPIVGEALSAPGHPLDRTTRAYFQMRFGHDLEDVRVHTGAEAAASARAIDARAYTAGMHVVFDSGEYAPETTAGQALLAHELTHVVQQSESSPRVQRQQPGATGQQQRQNQQPPNLMKIYSFGPTGAGRYVDHTGAVTVFNPRAPVDAEGRELVRAGTTAQPILSRFGRWFQLDERQRPLTPPVPNASIGFHTWWNPDGSSEEQTTSQNEVGTYYGPGETLGSPLGSEFIFRNDRPGRLTVAYILDHPYWSLITLAHQVHYVNERAAPPGATVLPDHPAAPRQFGTDTS